jgi:hypothetical protein
VRLRAAQAAGLAWSELAVLCASTRSPPRSRSAREPASVRINGGARFLDRPEVRPRSARSVGAARPAGSSRAWSPTSRTTTAPVPTSSGTSDGRATGAGTSTSMAARHPRRLPRVLNVVAGQAPDVGRCRQLLTFHRAKGLEFDRVRDRARRPRTDLTRRTPRRAERRLLARRDLRAEHSLHLSYAKQRTLGMRTVNRVRSLARTDRGGARAGAPPPVSRRGRPGWPRRATAWPPLDPSPTRTTATRRCSALVSGGTVCRASGVPAYVFHDTLRAVASISPATGTSSSASGIGPVKAERHGGRSSTSSAVTPADARPQSSHSDHRPRPSAAHLNSAARSGAGVRAVRCDHEGRAYAPKTRR